MPIIKISTADGEIQSALYVDKYSSLAEKIERLLKYRPKQLLIKNTDDRGVRLDSEEAFKKMLGKYGNKLELVAVRDGERSASENDDETIDKNDSVRSGSSYPAQENKNMNHASQFANTNREVIETMRLKSEEIKEDQSVNSKIVTSSCSREQEQADEFDKQTPVQHKTESYQNDQRPQYQDSTDNKNYPSEESIVMLKLSLGDAYQASKAYAKAAKNYQEALNLLRGIGNGTSYDQLIASTLYKLSLAQAGQGKFSESGVKLRESLAIHKKIRKDSNQVCLALAQLQNQYEKQLDPNDSFMQMISTGSTLSGDQAIDFYTDALVNYRQTHTDQPSDLGLGVLLCSLTLAYVQQEKYREAVETFKECWDISKRVLLNDESISISLSIIAKLHSKNRNWIEAVAHHRKCLNLRHKMHSDKPEHADIVASLDDLAEVYEQLGDLEKAITYTKGAFSLRKSQEDPFNLDFAECLIKLADLHCKSDHLRNTAILNREFLKLCQAVIEVQSVYPKLNKIAIDFVSSYTTVRDDEKLYGEITKTLNLLLRIENGDSESFSVENDFGRSPQEETPNIPPNPPKGPSRI